jgi:NAD(P)-dependent dehydrogenase (short-subunit alcohol dehydrogenase family)
MGALDGRVAIVTGAGRGIGREHALLFAREGACVVVNDLGGETDGSGHDRGPAALVAEEIRAAGGQAIANSDDVADWDGSRRLIDTAIQTFGDLHVLVNNAGILRDRMLVNMTEADWDSVIRVHLRGHALPTHWAAAYWRAQSKADVDVRAAVVNTTSTSGLFGNVGQTNYGAAKSGIASFTMICQLELERYGVRCNAIAPAALTRLTEALMPDEMRHAVAGEFDPHSPANVSPFVAYLATEECPIKGRVFFVQGGEVHLIQPWAIVETIATDHRWTVAELANAAAPLAAFEFTLRNPLEG